MALFHSTTKIISRSFAGNAVAATAYRSGTRMTCARTRQVFNYTRKKEVTYRAILAPPNSPPWIFDGEKLANEIERVEKSRVNAQLFREVQVALPRELTPEQHIQLLNEYVQEQFISMGMVGHICLHDKKDPANPHAHILLTLRDITSDGFGVKRRDWNDRALVTQWREAWATACNAALERAGSTERIDHRSNKDRGIDTLATKHLGRRTPWNAQLYDDKAAFNAWVQTSIELAKIRSQIQQVQSQIIDLTTTLGQVLAERNKPKPRNDAPASSPVSTPTTPTTVWTPASELRIAPANAASLLHRSRTSTHQQRSTPGANPSTPPSGPHDRTATFKETPSC